MDFNSFKIQDFDEFKSKISQSAMAAAEVVQKLNDLDELAEDDEYLKTDKLNVKQRDVKQRNLPETFESTEVDAESKTPAQPLLAAPTVPDEEDTTTTTPFFSPEERAQQLVAQALFQTPLSSAPASRRDSRSTSFADYASAKEEELEDPLVSKDATTKDWSLLDTVPSPDPTASGKGKKDDEPNMSQGASQWRYNNRIGRNMNQEMNQETTTEKKQNPYMLSVVAKLMDGADDDGNEADATKKSSSNGLKDSKDRMEEYVASSGHGRSAVGTGGNNADLHSSDEPDAYEQSHSLQSAGLHYDSDSSSDDSGDSRCSGDPILSLMQIHRETKSKKASPQVEHTSAVQGKSDLSQEEMPTRKDPNRFFHDLDRRLENEVSQEPVSEKYDEEAGSVGLDHGIRHEAAIPESFAQATDKFQWLRNVAAPRILDSVSKNLKLMERSGEASSAASSADSRRQHLNGARGASDDEINVVVSSSLLAAEEHAELERLKQSTNQSLLTTLVGLVSKNPRFAFIGFTMLLSSFVYFYSRKRTEDDVTR